jgi:hypothetical protein
MFLSKKHRRSPLTLEDFLPIVGEEHHSSSPRLTCQQRVRRSDPELQLIQNLNQDRGHPGGPIDITGPKLTWVQCNPSLALLSRRLTHQPETTQHQTYAEVLMASGVVMVAGAGDDQHRGRNYGGQFQTPHGNTQPPMPYGHGRGRDRGRDFVGRG